MIRCPCAVAAKVIDAVNGDGPAPAAITLGGTILIFGTAASPELIRHEETHVDQAAACCPRWLRWLPRRSRAWVGAPAFWRRYVAAHLAHGYADNPYEVEARRSESIPRGAL